MNMINKVFGTGGFGTGIFFKLDGDEIIGRNESRAAYLTDFRDYCKGHIILHYISTLNNTGAKIFAIAKVGQDEQGSMLIDEMKSAGIDVKYVEATNQARTMFSVCFQYPDGAGGNITASNSACMLISPEYIERCSGEIDCNSLILAAPEAPLASRVKLLEIGKSRGAFTASSFLSAEASDFEEAGGFLLSDLVSINMDEAKAVGQSRCSCCIADAAAKKIRGINPDIKLIVTAGADGCYIYERGESSRHIPPVPVKEKDLASTAGAGDALLGGTVAGLINGKSFAEAVEYGMIAARFAVMSENTIAKDATVENIQEFIKNL